MSGSREASARKAAVEEILATLRGVKLYEGHFKVDGRAVVYADGEPLDPKPSQKVFNHSPDGFNWGYGGSGPSQLSLAILLHEGLHETWATRLKYPFKIYVIARLPQGQPWALDGCEVRGSIACFLEAWMEKHPEECEGADESPLPT